MTYEEAQKDFEEYMEASAACPNCNYTPIHSFKQLYALDPIRVREEWDNFIGWRINDDIITEADTKGWGSPY